MSPEKSKKTAWGHWRRSELKSAVLKLDEEEEDPEREDLAKINTAPEPW